MGKFDPHCSVNSLGIYRVEKEEYPLWDYYSRDFKLHRGCCHACNGLSTVKSHYTSKPFFIYFCKDDKDKTSKSLN